MKTRQKRRAADAPAPKTPTTIEPHSTYSRPEAAKLLRMRVDRLTEEVNAGRMKVKIDGRRWLFLGTWLIAWLEK